jgi:peptidyl-prolyl cis-trans isomerase D
MKLILWILVTVVIVTFIPWGVGVRMRSREDKRPDAAGEVFGKTVSFAEFNDARMAVRTDSLLRRANLDGRKIDERAWERLLMLAQARKEGILVSDKELARTIRKQFGGENNFDQETYENILRNIGATPGLYEKWLRQSLMIVRLAELARLTAWMPDEELERRRIEEESRLTISYVLNGIAEAEKGITVGDEEIKKYYDENASEFKLPPMVKARYVTVPFGSVAEQPPVTDEQVERYYNDRRRQFTHEKRVHARQILIKADGKDGEKAGSEAQALADKIVASLKKGRDFAALARKYSQDEKTKKKGGDLGYKESRELPQAIASKAFAMKEGEVSDVIQTPGGYYIVKVEGFQNPGIRPLDEVKQQLKSVMERDRKERALEEVKRTAYARAVDVSLALVDTPKLDDVAKKYSLEIQETEPFAERGAAKDVPRGEFVKTAFNTEIGSFSDIVEIPREGYCIIVPKEKTEERTKSLDEARAEIVKKLKEQKAKEMVHDLTVAQREKVEKKMKDEKLGFASACKALEIKAEETAPFTVRARIPGIGFAPEVAIAASKLNAGGLSAVFDVAKGSCFFTLLKREEPPAKEKAEGADLFARRTLAGEARKFMSEWSKWVRNQAQVVDYTTAASQTEEETEEPEGEE